jgi:hypothetical protein
VLYGQRQAGRWAFIGRQSVTIEWLFRPDRRRQIDTVIDYFGGNRRIYNVEPQSSGEVEPC